MIRMVSHAYAISGIHRWALMSVLLFISTWLQAQSSLRCISIEGGSRSLVLLDSMVIEPESIVLTPQVEFSYDADTQTLKLGADGASSVRVCYRVLPLPKQATYAHKSRSLYDSTAAFSERPTINNYVYEKEELFTTPEIYKTGSLSRGVTFGNSQSLNVNSVFNFQMDGKLSDNLNIRADITDQNVPFQPEGNTQQLREFDNITFEIYNEDLSLKAGDVVLTNGKSNFMRYYKNVQGGQFDIVYEISEKVSARSTVAIAAAKGQFADVTVAAVEGLQGPYQLPGPDGQRFIVVMANSEQVYLDGRPLTRGYNHDYVIDYNLGEITFNPTVQITQFSRIRVTYEYSDQNYSRSVISARQEIKTAKSSFHLEYYREKDNANKPLAFVLSDADKTQMSLAGDELLPVPIHGASEADYNPNLVLYEKRDTLDLDGNAHSIFVYSRDSSLQLYRVSYSNVGAGQGAYELLINDVNGRVYQWVSPSSGLPQGAYEAVRFVPAPNSRQLLVVGAETHLTKHVTAFGEMAFSNQDLNLYSPIGNEDNQDLAYKVGLKADYVPLQWMPKSTLSAAVDFEYNGADFKSIDRYRSIEYDRDWSYQPQNDTFRTANHIFNSTLLIHRDFQNEILGRFSMRQKENAIDGFQHEVDIKKSLGAFKWAGGHFYLQNENLTEKSKWRRWYSEIFMDKFFVVPGYKIQQDENEVKLAANDSLYRTAMNYTAHQFYLRNNDSLKVNYRLDYTLREDRNVQDGLMLPYARSKTASANASTYINKSNRLDLTFTYRQVAYQERFDYLEDENSILGRLNWQGGLLDGHIRTDLSYATSSSRELLREYIYVEVAAGEGTHTWRDLNQDGVQDLTEFFDAVNFDERTHIRVFVPTTDFVNAYNTVFIFSINSQMPRRWVKSGGIAELLSKISNRSSVNINKKNTNDDFSSRFNPFELNIDNADLIYVRDALRTVFFFNRSGRGFGGDVGYQVNHSKQLITRGIESRANREYTLNLRMHLSQQFTLTGGFKRSEKENASQFQENRNYLIKAEELMPSLIWQPANNLRFSSSYRLAIKNNLQVADHGEHSEIHEFLWDARWSNGVKNALNANFRVSKIDFVGDLNNAAAYELLEALQPGVNYSWQFNYNQKLISGLQMTLGYEGRKSVDRPTIHMGRMQVTALF
ncbi:hypothetical protein N7E81_02205 [Reichenbachiella carrageenanivorans]|uniref:Cell surface protein SprA n=1 Tax=Reichenbachiella carrageenanivorans TaxID=2979869 RepID=A0ABY6D174_9BACT|nr:hypothetical protein [Reichenbachiella carrageenanivorans]UXX79917.1 hypothetical protein N7E81_02205 [Reichenbachiella carrageenanivorans]